MAHRILTQDAQVGFSLCPESAPGCSEVHMYQLLSTDSERNVLTNSSLLDLLPADFLGSQGFRVSGKDEVWKGHVTSYLAGDVRLALEISAYL